MEEKNFCTLGTAEPVVRENPRTINLEFLDPTSVRYYLLTVSIHLEKTLKKPDNIPDTLLRIVFIWKKPDNIPDTLPDTRKKKGQV